MYILSISCFYHESAAALIKDGIIIAASSEERFSRLKHDPDFPTQAIDFCLTFAAIDAAQLDYIVFYEKPFLKFERNVLTSLHFFPKSSSFFALSLKNSLSRNLWIKLILAQKLKVEAKKIHFVPHHLSHAAASFYPSPFEQAAFLTIDGVGEWTSTSWGEASGNKLKPIVELRYPHSIGLLYSTITAYLGFKVNDEEYSVMGLAAYGKPKHVNQLKKLYIQYKDGSIELNLDYFSFFVSDNKMYSKKLEQLFLGLEKSDIAASLQYCLEEILMVISNYIKKHTKMSNLVYGGGVALNSVANQKLLKAGIFKSLFVYPASGDDGGAVGAGLYFYHHILDQPRTNLTILTDPFLGISSTNKQIATFLESHKIKAKYYATSTLAKIVAKKLEQQKVIGLVNGRAEFGPRALGHRSILADPRSKEMKDLINQKIKYREQFRPFAPVVLKEQAKSYFNNLDGYLSSFMLGTFETKKVTQNKAPSIVHVDRSSRVQVISKDYPGILRKILEYFFQQTGVPILLNTSFNLKGEPIVNTAEDAYKTFLNSDLDILVLENYLIEK